MYSSSSPSSPSSVSSFSLLANIPTLSPRHHRNPLFHCPTTLLTRHSLCTQTLRSSATNGNTSPDLSWLPSNGLPLVSNFNGWEIRNAPVSNDKKPGFPTFLVVGIGTSVAILVAALAHFSLSRHGFKLPFRNLYPGISAPLTSEIIDFKSSDSKAPVEENEVFECIEVSSEVDSQPMTSEKEQTDFAERKQPRLITVSVDSNQQESLSVLKKLKIVEEDVKADKLCTRREYARWLVRASSFLERNPKYKIAVATALAGSVVSAYEDVAIGDQDFDSIQALAEAGIVLSKLSSKNSSDDGSMYFVPESFISRVDLIEWRAQLEYDFAVTGNQEMLSTKLDLMDVKEVNSEKWPGLLMDLLAGDESLLRRVFGRIRRLEPSKPSTVAQAAVALTAGRITNAIHSELLRMDAEETSRQAAKEEIKHELLDRGEIQQHWVGKMEEAKGHGLEVQQLCVDAQKELEQEMVIQEIILNEHLKEKAAMDCQKQLLNVLKEEVEEMSERLVSERAELIAEEEAALAVRSDLETKKEGMLDAKSILEAEIEALRILRSWIEDEARKSQARSRVLEEVGRRWKWDQNY